MSWLVFDIDRGLSSVGGEKEIVELFGMPPIPVANGGAELKGYLRNLFDKVVTKFKHPASDEELVSTKFVRSKRAESLDLEGIIIDTGSFLAMQQRHTLVGQHGLTTMNRDMWGLHREINEDLYMILKELPVKVIVNMHPDDITDDISGAVEWIPAVKGGHKTNIAGEFTACLKSEYQKGEYVWRTVPHKGWTAVGARGLSLPDPMPQDFTLLFGLYADIGIDNPNIMILGPSKTGKTYALRTLAGLK